VTLGKRTGDQQVECCPGFNPARHWSQIPGNGTSRASDQLSRSAVNERSSTPCGKDCARFHRLQATPLVIMAALLLGGFAIWQTPRGRAQIVVPMLDVMVQMPGASADEVQQRVSVPMEKLLREVRRRVSVLEQLAGMSLVIVRFYVARRKRTRSSRPTTSCTPTSIAFRLAFRSQSSKCARLTTCPFSH